LRRCWLHNIEVNREILSGRPPAPHP
jgi:hypothetical protein